MDKINKIIGFPHPPQKHGGPGSFQIRLETALIAQGWKVVYPEDDVLPDVILVIGGTKKLRWLKRCKKNGAKVVHRLDGMNWLHRLKKMPLKHKILCEVRNRMTARIRRKYADHIIYQSQFVKDWWEKVRGPVDTSSSIIYNAVSLDEFHVRERKTPKNIICVEGNIDYTPSALETLKYLANELDDDRIGKVIVYGDLENKTLKAEYPEIEFMGDIPREKIPEVYKGGIYLSLDINAACPNTVIEALASGIPVVGFDTGALGELVRNNSGEIVDYGGDPWKLDSPNDANLKEGILKIISSYEVYANNARAHSVENFSLEILVEKYINILKK